MKKRSLLFVCMILLGLPFFAQNLDNQFEMLPSKIKETESDKATVEFKTDISNVEVYLNGSFYGRTNLEVKDLFPGSYSVELKLAGYETEKFMIQAKKNLAQTYVVEMKLIQGSIALMGLSQGASIFVDDKEFNSNYEKTDTNVIYTTPGLHKVVVKHFGLTDFEEEVKVTAYNETSVQIKMPVADFEIKNFTATKNVFNPDYKGRLGSCNFTFYVTNSQKVVAKVFDSNGQLVWTHELDNFKTWNQSFLWNGKSDSGKVLENGDYVVKLTSDNFEEQVKVTISRSVDYPLFSANAVGSGIGNLPAVFGSHFDYLAVFLNTSPIVAVNLKESAETRKNYFYGLGLNAGVIWNFAEYFELSGQAFTLPGHESTFVGRLNGSFKASDSVQLANKMTFSYGGLVRVGFSSNGFYEPFGIENGSGVGLGGLLGLSADKWNAGFSSQFIYSASTGKLSKSDCVWKNAFTGSYKPIKALSLNGWLGLNSAVNLSAVSSQEINAFIFGRGLNYGAGITWLPFSSTILVNLNIDGNVIFKEANYVSFQIGLSYLF